MMKFFVICSMCIVLATADDTYRAGAIMSMKKDPSEYIPLIQEAVDSNVDILVLPTKDNVFEDNYEESVKTLSESAKQAGVYIIANLNERIKCQNNFDHVRNNLAFDRKGNMIAVYRKSLNTISNCTNSSPDIATFTTDFGVTFGMLTEEDLVLRNAVELQGVNNFVVIGSWSSEVPFLSAAQFTRSWAYVNKANVISSFDIKPESDDESGDLIFADLKKNGGTESTPPATSLMNHRTYPDEDLSQYIIRPLNLEASSQGYRETVCHNKLCCEFYVKSSSADAKQIELSYGLAVFDGVRSYGHNKLIGAQNCAIFACAGLYKRSCSVWSGNSTNIFFDKIVITGNFSKSNSAQFPMLLTTHAAQLSNKQLKFTTKPSKEASAELSESSVLSFGIIGRDYSRDYENFVFAENESQTLDIYGYIFNDDMQEYFDYLWIRVRILMVVVSIYVLEMM